MSQKRLQCEQPNSALKILVCYHKPYTLPPTDDGILLPVQGGKALSDSNLGLQTDSDVNGQTCDNISNKNDCYCECTVMYWAWKNLKKLYPDVKYVGLFHYRRFLALRNFPFRVAVAIPTSNIESYRVDSQKAIKILESGRIIVPKKMVFPHSIKTQYCLCYASEDYRSTKEVIRTKFPDYYDDFVSVMERGNSGFLYNMFIMKYEDFCKYCEWLFAVLAEVEPLVPYQHYSVQQKRLFGAIAERMINVYIRKNNLKTACTSMYFYDEGAKTRGLLWRNMLFFLCCAEILPR